MTSSCITSNQIAFSSSLTRGTILFTQGILSSLIEGQFTLGNILYTYNHIDQSTKNKLLTPKHGLFLNYFGVTDDKFRTKLPEGLVFYIQLTQFHIINVTQS